MVFRFFSEFTPKALATKLALLIVFFFVFALPVSATDVVIDEYVFDGGALSAQVLRSGNVVRRGQCFNTGSYSGNLNSATFYVSKYGSPPGDVTVSLYSATGTLGSTCVGTGSALATTQARSASGFQTSVTKELFVFNTPYVLTASTDYVLVVEYSSGDASNNIRVHEDGTSPTHEGNLVSYGAGTWSAGASADEPFSAIKYLTDPELVITSASASPSAGLTYMSFSGDTSTTSATMKCNVYIGQICDNASPPVYEQKLLTVKLDALYPLSNTQKVDPSLYYGSGFSASSSAWMANVEVPYRGTASCDYPQSLECYHTENGQIVLDIYDSPFDNFMGGSWYGSTMSATIMSYPTAEGYTEDITLCAEGEWWCKLTTRLFSGVWNMIKPSWSVFSDDINIKKQALLARAPFAYFTPVLAMLSSDPSSSSAIPIDHFTFVGFTTGNLTINYAAPVYLTNGISTIKTTLTFVIYGSLIVYFVFKMNQVLDDG